MEIRLLSTGPVKVAPRRDISAGHPPQDPPTAADGYAGPTASAPAAPLSGASEGRRATTSNVRRVVMAGLASLALTGGILGGIIASHASMHPAVESVQQTSAVQTPQQQRAEIHKLIDGMIDAGLNGREVPDSLRQMVHGHLDALPLDVVKTVAGNGARIAIMKQGETPADVGVIKDLDMARFSDTAGLRKLSDDAFKAADATHGGKLASLQARFDAAQTAAREHYKQHPQDIPRPQGLSAMLGTGDPAALDPTVQKLGGEVYKARLERLITAWDQLNETSKGRLEPFAASVSGFDMNISAILRHMPTSVEAIAAQHGARTPAEVKAFSDLMIAANGPRLKAAQDDFHAHLTPPRGASAPAPAGATDDPKASPPTAGMGGGMVGGVGGGGMVVATADYAHQHVSQRLFIAGDSDIVVPSFYFLRTTDNPAEKPRIVSGHDFLSMNDWKSGRTAGQYWYQDDRKTIVYHEQYLKEDTGAMTSTVHEFGHAYMAALQARDPQFYATFLPRWDATYHLDGEYKEGHRFPSNYAATNRGEFFAEEFSAHFGREQAELEKRDPTAAALMREALAEAPHIARWNIAGR